MTGQALLLAAGVGTRLRPLTHVLPKCLAPICGRPLLGYWLAMLAKADFGNVVVNLHHHADLVRAYVGKGPYATRVKLVFEEKLLGTGGTLLANRRTFREGPILVAHADNLSLFDPQVLLSQHSRRPKECMMTMMTFEADHPSSCGIVETNEAGVVIGFHEKVLNPPGRLANAAVYVFEHNIFDELDRLGSKTIDLSTEIIPRMIGRAFTYRNPILHRDVGTMRSLVAAQFELSLLQPAYAQGASPDVAWDALVASGSPPLRDRVLDAVKEYIGV